MIDASSHRPAAAEAPRRARLPRRLGSLARYAWASPATLAGLALLALACASGARPRRVAGTIEVTGGGIPHCVGLLPRACRFGAITFGHVILALDEQTAAHARAHEHVHVRQYERWGPLFFPLYVGSSLVQLVLRRDPYRDNRFEREAYARERT